MATFLVTGGAGFIGSHVCDRLLAEGDTVIAVDDLSRGRASNLREAQSYRGRFSFHRVDVRSDGPEELFAACRPDVVFHLAAQSGVRPSLRDPMLDAEINVVGLLRVLEAARRSEVRKVIFAGSGGTLYGRPRRLPARERARYGARPENPYAISKKVAEDYLRFYRARHGLDFTFLAMSNVYGPRQNPHGEAGVVAVFAEAMLGGRSPTIFGTGDQTRDYVYVTDVADAFHRAIDRASGRLLNIATGLETSVSAIHELVARETGYDGEPVFGPSQGDDLPRSSLDPSLAAQVLGWRPTIALEEGIRLTVGSLRR